MRAWAGAAVLVAIASGTTACASERDRALDYATTVVQKEIDDSLSSIEWSVSDGLDRESVVDSIKRSRPTAIFAGRSIEGGFELDMVVHGRGEAGGGWSYTDVWARACVRVSIRHDRSPAVDAAALACPLPLSPGETGDHGAYNETVEYEPKTASR
jgi:hypothetical protein